jgi:hypothetical protein
MEGRYPNGLLLAITNCNDASKGDEFARWYNHIHFPDVTASGIFKHSICKHRPRLASQPVCRHL